MTSGSTRQEVPPVAKARYWPCWPGRWWWVAAEGGDACTTGCCECRCSGRIHVCAADSSSCDFLQRFFLFAVAFAVAATSALPAATSRSPTTSWCRRAGALAPRACVTWACSGTAWFRCRSVGRYSWASSSPPSATSGLQGRGLGLGVLPPSSWAAGLYETGDDDLVHCTWWRRPSHGAELRVKIWAIALAFRWRPWAYSCCALGCAVWRDVVLPGVPGRLFRLRPCECHVPGLRLCRCRVAHRCRGGAGAVHEAGRELELMVPPRCRWRQRRLQRCTELTTSRGKGPLAPTPSWSDGAARCCLCSGTAVFKQLLVWAEPCFVAVGLRFQVFVIPFALRAAVWS